MKRGSDAEEQDLFAAATARSFRWRGHSDGGWAPGAAAVGAEAAGSVKRVRWCDPDWDAAGLAQRLRRLDWLEPFVEVKTLWHPVSGW